MVHSITLGADVCVFVRFGEATFRRRGSLLIDCRSISFSVHVVLFCLDQLRLFSHSTHCPIILVRFGQKLATMGPTLIKSYKVWPRCLTSEQCLVAKPFMARILKGCRSSEMSSPDVHFSSIQTSLRWSCLRFSLAA